jgi:hypothetical protein
MDQLNRKLGRRNFLARLGGAAVAYSFGSLISWLWAAPAQAETVRTGSGRVTRPKGKNPGRRVKRVVRGDQPKGFTVPAGQTWEVKGLVTTPKNVVVYGTLRMRPGATLRFRDINESAFKGGDTAEPFDSDVGLWIQDHGILDAQGTPKLAWARTTDGLAAGVTSLTLDADPVGWKVGDDLVLTPTEHPSVGERSHTGFEPRRITAISGRTVRLATPLAHAHPSTRLPNGRVMCPEVLNISRDCRIEGQPGKRAHIILNHCHCEGHDLRLSHVGIYYMGPRRNFGDSDRDVILGRYPLHFHMMHDASRGTLVDGVVIAFSGNHAFVPHSSHGVTFRDCIAYDNFEAPYWWDEAAPTFDITFERCVAAVVKTLPEHRGFKLSAFVLGFSPSIIRPGRNKLIGCVAIGVQGNKDSAGYVWPEAVGGTWTFQDCVGHNNKISGIFVWQNNGQDHPIERFVAYRNGLFGIEHGAYGNRYNYDDTVLHENGWAALKLHATSEGEPPDLHFKRVDFGGLVMSVSHAGTGSAPTLFENCRFRAGVSINDEDGEGSVYDFVNCDPLEPSAFTIVKLQPNSSLPGGRIRVQRKDGTAYHIDQTGTKTISAFA